jgi:hypothetical protein
MADNVKAKIHEMMLIRVNTVSRCLEVVLRRDCKTLGSDNGKIDGS